MYRATYYVTLMVDVPVGGDNFTQAFEAAAKKRSDSIVKVKHGELIDAQIQLQSVSDSSVNGEM